MYMQEIVACPKLQEICFFFQCFVLEGKLIGEGGKLVCIIIGKSAGRCTKLSSMSTYTLCNRSHVDLVKYFASSMHVPRCKFCKQVSVLN